MVGNSKGTGRTRRDSTDGADEVRVRFAREERRRADAEKWARDGIEECTRLWEEGREW